MNELTWYVARGSGVVSLVLLTAVVALGVATRGGATLRGVPPFAVAAVHRSAALLSVVFVAVHVVALLVDAEAPISFVDVLVPFGGDYRPFFVGLGTIALYLLAAVVLTSVLRERIGRRAWRAVHWTAYALWPVALLHGIGSGTDRAAIWMIAVDVACVAAVGAAFLLHPAVRGERARGPEPVPIRTATVPYALTTQDRR